METRRLKKQRVRVGDILLNHFASDTNPSRKSLIVATSPKYITTVYANNGKIRKSSYTRDDVAWLEEFEIIGHVGLYDMLKQVLNR